MKIFDDINDYFSDTETESFCLTREEWQTLKAELAQQSTNSASAPCKGCIRADDAGQPIDGYHQDCYNCKRIMNDNFTQRT